MTNFDPSGTSPGVVSPQVQGPKTQSMRCRNEGCPSLQAVEITPELNRENAGVPHHRTYQCIRCKHTWTMSVGGFVNF